MPMTTVSVPLSEEAERGLRKRATARGSTLEEYARTVLEREAGVPLQDPETEAWIERWRSWCASRPRSDHFVDDSRESIYEGCGE